MREEYNRNGYRFKSWAGSLGNGRCEINDSVHFLELSCRTGKLPKPFGKSLPFQFDLMFTPVRYIDWKAHWMRRSVQIGYHNQWKPSDLDACTIYVRHRRRDAGERQPLGHCAGRARDRSGVAAQAGRGKKSKVTLVNLHQGTEANPFINYPLDMKSGGAEIFALHSMNDILLDGFGSQRDGMSPRIKDDVTRKQAQMLWRLWDAFGIEHSQMLGYWNSECPVQIKKPHKNLRATAYVREDIGVSLVVVGNFGHAKSHKSVEVLFAKQHSAYATIVFGDRLEMSAPKYGNVRMDLKGKGGMLFASTMGSYPLVRLQKRISDDIY